MAQSMESNMNLTERLMNSVSFKKNLLGCARRIYFGLHTTVQPDYDCARNFIESAG